MDFWPKNVGEVSLVCNGWRKMNQTGQRSCWGRKLFDMSLFQTLPVVIKEKYHSHLGCHSSETDADAGKKVRRCSAADAAFIRDSGA